MSQKQKIGLIFMFILFLLLLNKPIIAIPTAVMGAVPSVMIYLLIVWLLLIVGMIIFSLRKTGRTDD